MQMRETEALGQGQRGCLHPQGSSENRLEQEPQGLGEVGGAPGRGRGRGTQRQGERAHREGAGCPGRQLPRGFRRVWRPPLSWPSAGLGVVEAVHKATREGPNPETQRPCGAPLQTGKEGRARVTGARGVGVEGGGRGMRRAASRSEQSQRVVEGWRFGVAWPDSLACNRQSRVSVQGGVMPKATLGAFLFPGHGLCPRAMGPTPGWGLIPHICPLESVAWPQTSTDVPPGEAQRPKKEKEAPQVLKSNTEKLCNEGFRPPRGRPCPPGEAGMQAPGHCV